MINLNTTSMNGARASYPAISLRWRGVAGIGLTATGPAAVTARRSGVESPFQPFQGTGALPGIGMSTPAFDVPFAPKPGALVGATRTTVPPGSADPELTG